MAAAIRASRSDILAANAEDLADGKAAGLTAAALDRLTLNDQRVEAMAEGLDVVRGLADPVGRVTESWTRPNGMTIERVKVPLGVVGVIYESRPNVTADAGALTLKAGNAVILRGGSDSHRSSRAIHAALAKGLREANLPEAAISLVPTRDRAAVGMMLQGLDGKIDVIVPRGGKSLVARVQSEARVPVFAHLEGVCHVYVDKAAALDMAKTIVMNAKLRRTGVCGAAETLLVDRAAASTASQAADRHAARRRLRGARRCRRAKGRRAREARERSGLVDRISRHDHHRRRGRWRRRGDRAHRALRHPPHRRDRHRRQGRRRKNSSTRSIPRSCCTTPRRNSPTAANSASAPRSASPPASCTPAARSASSSSRASSIASAARGRSGRERILSVIPGRREAREPGIQMQASDMRLGFRARAFARAPE